MNKIQHDPIAIKLMDKRFAKVMDWNILENNSGVNDGTEYTGTFVENK